MTNNKKLIFGGIIILAVMGLVFYFSLIRPSQYAGPSGDSGLEQNPTPTSDSTSSPQATPALSPNATLKPNLTLIPEPFLGLNGIKSPATCQIGGEIDFSDAGTFSTRDSQISWQNVDSQGRLINWRISPQDNLKIGPNIFANLTIPNGKYENLTVRLPETPVAKNYILTASVTYGQFVQGDLKVKEVNCSGLVKVNLNF